LSFGVKYQTKAEDCYIKAVERYNKIFSGEKSGNTRSLGDSPLYLAAFQIKF
jgi:hypothetical protein